MAKKQEELPGVEGEGVSPVKIKEIEVAADNYVEVRDKRMKLTEKEIASRDVVVSLMKKHNISKYVYDDHQIVLEHGADKVKVRAYDPEANSDQETGED